MGVHTVPGSPNTLHRTVATNTPPSPALQRRLGQASPSLARHPPPAGGSRDPIPSSPLVGRKVAAAAGGVPPSPLLGRRGHATPDELGAASRQDATQPPPTPAFPVSPQLPEKRHMSSGDAERTDNKSSCSNLSGAHTLPDVSKSIYGGCAVDRGGRDLGGHAHRFCCDPVSPPADGYPDIKMNVKFVQDTSKYWYKPDISREQGEAGGRSLGLQGTPPTLEPPPLTKPSVFLPLFVSFSSSSIQPSTC